MKVYIVYRPAAKNKDIITLITDDIEKAKKQARESRATYLKKGWQSWSNRVKIISPNTKDALYKIIGDFYDNYYLYAELSIKTPWWKKEVYGEWLELLNTAYSIE